MAMVPVNLSFVEGRSESQSKCRILILICSKQIRRYQHTLPYKTNHTSIYVYSIHTNEYTPSQNIYVTALHPVIHKTHNSCTHRHPYNLHTRPALVFEEHPLPLLQCVVPRFGLRVCECVCACVRACVSE